MQVQRQHALLNSREVCLPGGFAGRQVEDQTSDKGEILDRMPEADEVLLIPERHIEDPADLTLDVEVTPG